MLSKRTKGYTLIELLVVLGIITLIGLLSLPNIASRNNRSELDVSANRIKQMLIEAKTRSLAPTKSDGPSTGQLFQVAFGTFNAASANYVLPGSGSSTKITLERGLARCDSGDLEGGFTQLKNLTLPRGVTISKFYPSNNTPTDDQTVIRFAVGQVGFFCGSYANPIFESTKFSGGSGWSGKNANGNDDQARYAYIELSAEKITGKRYVTIDRLSGEVGVTDANPQSYFTALTDTLSPRWTDKNDAKFLFSLTCRPGDADVTITFPRANDRATDANPNGDPNLLLFYDLSWNINDGAGMRPIVTHYFYDLGQTTVSYSFTTTAVSIATHPASIVAQLVASDRWGNTQPQNDADENLKWWTKTFSVNCGDIVLPPGINLGNVNPQGGITSQSCPPPGQNITMNQDQRLIQKIRRWLGVDSAYAAVTQPPSISC